jgi:hypothetical protein
MNLRKDVLDLLDGKNPEYVPWFGDLAYWIDYLLDEDLMPEQYRQEEYGDKARAVTQGLASPFTGNGLHRLHEDLGVGFYLQGYFPFESVYDFETTSQETGNQRITTYVTPYGTLREIWEYIRGTHSWGPKEHLLKDCNDLKAFRYIYEHTEYKPDYELAQKRVERVGNNGIVVVYTPKSPFMELVALKAGIEAVTYMFMDAPEELEETLEVVRKKHDFAANIAIDSPGEIVFVPDNLSSEIVAGTFYNNYIKPVHRDWTGRIRLAGKKSFVHLDGLLKPLLSELSNVGFDVIEAVTPAPVGDVEPEDLRSYVKDQTIIWGGLPGGFFTDELSDEEFDAFVIRVLKVMKNDNRFVLGAADQVVPGSSFERIKRVRQLVEKFGKYDL